jgi:hypothetical protein
MTKRLEGPQGKWQLAALQALLAETGIHVRGPWVPAWRLMEAIQERESCSSQAATGALRALLTVGLADRAETREGLFWKPTEAAERMHDLIVPLLPPEWLYEQVDAIMSGGSISEGEE